MIVTVKAADGGKLGIDPDQVESVRPSAEGVVIRYLNGHRATVRVPYLHLLEQLADPRSDQRRTRAQR